MKNKIFKAVFITTLIFFFFSCEVEELNSDSIEGSWSLVSKVYNNYDSFYEDIIVPQGCNFQIFSLSKLSDNIYIKEDIDCDGVFDKDLTFEYTYNRDGQNILYLDINNYDLYNELNIPYEGSTVLINQDKMTISYQQLNSNKSIVYTYKRLKY